LLESPRGWSYFTVVENKRLIFDPWNLEVIEPLNRMPCPVAGSRQVRADVGGD